MKFTQLTLKLHLPISIVLGQVLDEGLSFWFVEIDKIYSWNIFHVKGGIVACFRTGELNYFGGTLPILVTTLIS